MNKIVLIICTMVLFYSKNHAQVNTESYRTVSNKTGLSITSEVELTLMAGNTDFQYFGSNTRLNYGWNENSYTFLILNGGFGRNEGKTFFSESLVHLRNVNALSKNIQLEAFAQYDNNKSLLLLNRYLAGAGLRFRILTTEDTKARYGTSLFIENEKYDLTPAAKHDAKIQTIRFSNYFTFTLKLKENLTFLTVSYLQPDIQHFTDFRILSNNALQVKLSKSMGLDTKIDLRYDSKPADSIKNFDLSSKIGLEISLE